MPKTQAIPTERPEETLGNRFRNARTSLDKSLQEAAQVTCINPTTLANLESDNFTNMPAEVFTRGFIKLYAQYLGLDVNETLKLYVNQEHLDQERPVEQPYRREIVTDASMANPLRLFKSSPRALIITVLLALLLGFYVLGAILKVGQKHPDPTAPENELAKSLVDGNTQPLPGPAGEPPTASGAIEQAGVPETAALTTTPTESQPAGGAASNPPAPANQASTDRQLSLPVSEKSAPAVSAAPEETGSGSSAGGVASGR